MNQKYAQNKGKIYCLAFSLLLGILAVRGMSVSVKTDDSAFTNSIFSFAALILSVVLIYAALQLSNKRTLIFSVVAGLLFSSMEIIGTSVFLTFSIPDFSLSLLLQIIGLGALFGAVILLILIFLPTIKEKIAGCGFTGKVSALFQPGKKYIALVTAVVLLCWLPVFIATFPGIFAYDAPMQVTFMHLGILDNHHPLFASTVLYAVMSFGNIVFGSYNIGLAIFISGQMAFGAWVIAYCCNFLNRHSVPSIVQLLAVLYYALLPVIQILMVNATKDVLFSILVLFLVVCVWDMILDPHRFFHSIALQVRFCLVALFMMLYRNNGVYIFLFLIPALIFFVWRFKKNNSGTKGYILRICALCLLSIIPYCIIVGPLFNALGVKSSNIVEMLAVPEQQMVCAYVNDSDKITQEQKDIMFEVLPYGTVEEYAALYHPRNSDPIRPKMDGEKFQENPARYIKNYIAIGLACPKDYVNALLNNTLGYWYPDMDLPDPNANIPYIEYQNSTYTSIEIMTDRYNFLPGVNAFYEGIANGDYKDIPGLSMLFSIGFTSWLLLFAGIAFWYHKKYDALIPVWMLFALWLTSFAGPVVILRYVFALFLALPLVVGMLFSREKKTYENDDKIENLRIIRHGK